MTRMGRPFALLATLAGAVLALWAAVVAVRRRGGGGFATCSAPSARCYEALVARPLAGFYRCLAAEVAEALAGVDEPAVLEVGPGPGVLAVELARRVEGLRLTGVDVDPAMVERATARSVRTGFGARLEFLVADVARLPFADGSFDLVTSSFSVHHWEDATAGFGEIRRVLRPGGRVLVVDLPDWWGRFERHARPIAESAAGGGFDRASVRPFRWPGRLSIASRLDAAVPVPT